MTCDEINLECLKLALGVADKANGTGKEGTSLSVVAMADIFSKFVMNGVDEPKNEDK